jgi:hypothetical protein
VATQKPGTDSHTSDATRVIVSYRLFWRMADRTPSGTPTSTATRMLRNASSTVTGTRRTISGVTGPEESIEVPRSPWMALPIRSPYCTYRGRSRPSFARICARACGEALALLPSIALATSPGSKRMVMKTTTLTPNRIGTSSPSRLTKYFSIRGRRLAG